MNTIQKPKFGLTNNQLKIIAMISMALDHIGLFLWDSFYTKDSQLGVPLC